MPACMVSILNRQRQPRKILQNAAFYHSFLVKLVTSLPRATFLHLLIRHVALRAQRLTGYLVPRPP